MSQTYGGLTEAQHEMTGALDDANEHLHWEFDPDEYKGFSTCGFAHIRISDGRCSFVQMIRGLAKHPHTLVQEDTRSHSGPEYEWSFGDTRYSLRKGHDGGYRLNVSANHLFDGPEYQRMDVQERIHRLVLERLRAHGYLNDAGIRSRMD